MCIRDRYYIKSNDAGGGLCWSNGTYVGPNGPSCCKNRPMTSRVSGFVEALAQGARQAGIDPVIHFNTNIGFKPVSYTHLRRIRGFERFADRLPVAETAEGHLCGRERLRDAIEIFRGIVQRYQYMLQFHVHTPILKKL